MSCVLVVGATRILRPAVEQLAAAGHDVVAVARDADDLAGLAATSPGRITACPADWSDPPAFAAALFGRRFDHALAYCPDAPQASLSTLRDCVDGPSVRVVTSAAARPAVSGTEPFDPSRLPPVPPPWHRLVLGWTPERRWHTPAEVSAAALDTLRAEQDRILGTVRPWSDRPA
jgi:nucleoside-diphosphate-sugar epimerase